MHDFRSLGPAVDHVIRPAQAPALKTASVVRPEPLVAQSLPLRAEFVSYMSGGRIHVGLSNRCAFVFPIDRIEAFLRARSVDLRSVQLLDGGASLYWPRLGVSLSLAALLVGDFGSPEWMQRLQASAAASLPLASRSARKPRADPSVSKGVDAGVLAGIPADPGAVPDVDASTARFAAGPTASTAHPG